MKNLLFFTSRLLAPVHEHQSPFLKAVATLHLLNLLIQILIISKRAPSVKQKSAKNIPNSAFLLRYYQNLYDSWFVRDFHSERSRRVEKSVLTDPSSAGDGLGAITFEK